MKKKKITIMNEHHIFGYKLYLADKERSRATIEKYERDIRKYMNFSEKNTLCQSSTQKWKQWLLDNGYMASSINSMLAALNNFFEYLNRQDCKVKLLKIQKDNFSQPNRELDRSEYQKLVTTAKNHGKNQLCLIMQTICSTGIRISELSFITVHAIMNGMARIHLKGKIRTIFLPDSIRSVLKQYIRKENIKEGPIFLSKRKVPIGRTSVWKGMKALCQKAGIDPTKVFPHNLRHLFARTHYSKYHDILRLSDILGHSSVDTTRIYTLESGQTHLLQLNQLDLVFCLKNSAT